ncbi:MAG: hypothetical protein OZSIB_3307 [Candidatus Ozemobacter sibiricus]|jgi:tetratricopeptide (TPR) repeat protein|uniref:Uncharacterized protein n=1 Tax=Candidatus Ozemobacter sibiricus TaxID=2268124 RepID=A0A367ZF64_9BACT|nr:MAG: hypothetical protein OZSIB_3307 [Candidatus Ozemobacter sibiricus]
MLAGLLAFFFVLAAGGSSLVQALSPQGAAFLEKSRTALKNKNALSAMNYFRQAKTTDPEDPELLDYEKTLMETINQEAADHLKAAEFYSRTDPPRAMQEYRYVLKLIPDHPEAKAGLQAMENVAKTVQKYREQGIVIAPDTGRSFDLAALSARDLFNRAKAAYDSDNLEQAMDFITRALERDPQFKQAMELREQIATDRYLRDMLLNAETCLSAGEYERAIDWHTALLRRNPEHWSWVYRRGLAYLGARRFDLAIADFLTLLKKWPQVERWQLRQSEAGSRATASSTAASTLATRFLFDERKRFSRQQVLANVSEALAGKGEYLKAAAVAAQAGRSWGFFWRCYVNGHPWLFLAMALVGVGGLAAFVAAWRMFDALIDRFSFKMLADMVRLLWRGLGGEITTEEGRLLALVRRATVPWFCYVTGLVLISNGKSEEALRHLQAALSSPGLAARAYFFLGVARQHLQQSLGEHDFEQAFLTGLQPTPPTWLPRFLRDLEAAVIARFVPKGQTNDRELRTLALKIIQA